MPHTQAISSVHYLLSYKSVGGGAGAVERGWGRRSDVLNISGMNEFAFSVNCV